MRNINRLREHIKSLLDIQTALYEEWAESNNDFKPKFSSRHWRTAEILGTLYAMHGRSCSYCQGVLTQSDRGDVEHFRPKSIYWWLAYNINNYLLSCGRCNRTCKRSNFPLSDDDLRLTVNGSMSNEPRLLIDPVTDQTEGLFEVNNKNGVWFVNPLSANEDENSLNIRYEFTSDFFKFNYNGLLVKERNDQIFKAIELAVSEDADDKKKASRLASRFSPHGIYVRKLFLDKFNDLIPSDEEEIYWLVEVFLEELHVYNIILDENPRSSDAKNLKEIICWALAAILNTPPAGSKDQIRTLINGQGDLNEINKYCEKISNPP